MSPVRVWEEPPNFQNRGKNPRDNFSDFYFAKLPLNRSAVIKFMRARVEFDEENPQSINKCTVGVTQSHSYSDLSSKSIAEIKELIANSSDVC